MRLMSFRSADHGSGEHEFASHPRELVPWAVGLLELVILAYGAALLVILVTGGIDLGFLRLNQAAKPVLILAIAIPVRLALRYPSWLRDEAGRTAQRITARARELASTPQGAAVADVAFAILATRTVTFSVGFLANLLFPPLAARSSALPFEAVKFAEIFVAWDSGWYFEIARSGYYFDRDGQSSTAFFPLYPLLMRALAWPFGGSDRALWVAGIFLSCASFALALLALHRFAWRVFGTREAARRTVLYVAVFPFSLFMTRVYSESLFLLTSVMAISGAHDHRWRSAGVWGALATITRPNGVLVAIPLLLLAIADRPGLRAVAGRSVWLLPVPAALGGFCAFSYSLSGDPLSWLSAQRHWGYFLWNPPWEQLLHLLGGLEKHGLYDYFFISPHAPFHFLHGMTALGFLALTPAVFKRLGAPMGTYVLVSLLIPLSSNSLGGIGRYGAVLFPVFMLLGGLRAPRVHECILIASCLLLAFFVALFVTLRPIY
jgi:hypothetical protein